ncbi:MAG: zinc-binding dehydrogenase [Actinomycetales bacterium]|nr:zinc-binding dehydrogenase [Actinomycetales bacterium]
MLTTFRPGYGPPEHLEIREAPVPDVSADEILVRVHASSVNRTDSGVQRGRPFIFRFFAGFPRPRYSATGTDFAGVVEAVGADVTEFSPGERVYGFDDTGLGTHAQYVALTRRTSVLRIPESLTFAEAVGLTEGAFYAVNFVNKVDAGPGSRILVIGGTGAIGSSAIQILVSRGVHVDAVAPVEHADLVRSLGATMVFDAGGTDHLVGTRPYDVVFDAVGKSRFSDCRAVLTEEGAYLSSELGPRGENLLLPAVTRARGGPRVTFPIPRDVHGSLAYVRRLAQRGQFRAVIDRTYPLADVRKAFEYVESGQKIGTVVLDLE